MTVVLAALSAICGRRDDGPAHRLRPIAIGADASVHGVLQATGLLFFAFAGYARIATLGEEVRDPARTIPRAIPLALGIALIVYAVVAVAAAGRVRQPAASAVRCTDCRCGARRRYSRM